MICIISDGADGEEAVEQRRGGAQGGGGGQDPSQQHLQPRPVLEERALEHWPGAAPALW